MPSDAALLQAYDDQLRIDAEVTHATTRTTLGPLHLATFSTDRGFITYRDLRDVDDLDGLVARALSHFSSDPRITSVEWKTRSHDVAPGLHDALVSHGFAPDDPESVMIGEAALLAVEVALPEDVVVRRVTSKTDICAMVAMQDEVFGASHGPDWLLRRVAEDATIELWIAQSGTKVVSAGRLEPVEGTDLAGLWGGATLPEWRGRGIYRALTAARARSALQAGKSYLQCDCTEYSRPILERSGLRKLSQTQPYVWRRESA